jgi:putative transposase
VYHVLNRANARMEIFDKEKDYDAFERILGEAVRRVRMRLLAYCVMPNHWHLVVWPREDGDLSRFVGWLTLTHTQRWHAHRHTVGSGHVYQGRFKSFLVESDEHLWTVCRYVERNALRAGLCSRAEEWRWSSVWRREFGDAECKGVLCEWPIGTPQDWLRRVNRAESQRELAALRRCANRSQPYGSEAWVDRMTRRFDLGSTFRPRGRPHKEAPNNGS